MAASTVRAGRAYVELYATSDRLNEDLKKGLAKVQAFAAQAAEYARVNIVATIAIAYPIKNLIDDYAKFDDKMRIVGATTRAVGQDFQELTNLARELGRTTSFTAQDAASGMVALGRSGFDPDEIKTLIGHFLDLSRATATELPRSIEIASAVLRGFNFESNQAARVADVLTVAANRSAQTLDDLGESYKYVASLAREEGMSFEESAKALAFLANMGIKGTMAATAMRNILMRMSQKDIQLKYHELGVDVVNRDTGALRKLSEVMLDLSKAVQKVPQASRLGIFRELFGLYGLAGGASLASGADFDKIFEAIDKADGRARDVAQEMDAGIGGKMRLAWSEIKDMFLSVGETIAPALEEILAQVDEFTEKFKSFLKENAVSINEFIRAGAAIVRSALDVGAFVAKLTVVYAPLTKFMILLQGAKGYLLALAYAVKSITNTFNLLRASLVGVGNVAQKAFLVFNEASAKTFGGTSIKEQLEDAEYRIRRYQSVMADYQKKHAAWQKARATFGVGSAQEVAARADVRAAMAALLHARADERAAKAAMKRIQTTLTLVRALGSLGAVAAVGATIGKILLGSEEAGRRAVEKHTEAVREQGDVLAKRQEQEKAAMERLGELSKKEKLNNNETQEAQRLIAQLANRYGDLGLKIDEATGKLNGFAEAQASMNEKQTQALIQQKRAELQAQKSRLEYLKRQYKLVTGTDVDTFGDWMKSTVGTWRDWASWTGLVESRAEKAEEFFNQIQNLKADIGLNENELNNLEGQHQNQNDLANGSPIQRGIVGAERARQLEDSMYGAAEATKYYEDVFKDYYDNLQREVVGTGVSKIEAAKLEKGSLSADEIRAIAAANSEEFYGKFERAFQWLEDQRRNSLQTAEAATLQNELISANRDLAQAIQNFDYSSISEARKTIAETNKKIGEQALKAAIANAEAAKKAYELAQTELKNAQDKAAAGDTSEMAGAQNRVAVASANLQNANSALTSAIEKVGNPLEKIVTMGTFSNREALDITSGNNALLSEERQQSRALENLSGAVNNIYTYLQKGGEYV